MSNNSSNDSFSNKKIDNNERLQANNVKLHNDMVVNRHEITDREAYTNIIISYFFVFVVLGGILVNALFKLKK